MGQQQSGGKKPKKGSKDKDKGSSADDPVSTETLQQEGSVESNSTPKTTVVANVDAADTTLANGNQTIDVSDPVGVLLILPPKRHMAHLTSP